MNNKFVVISGLPGSGKSSVARVLANQLGVPRLDKDEILETYFQKYECADEQARHRLSRSADDEFQSRALEHKLAVLDSFWRHPLSVETFGTPSKWLDSPAICAVEVYCKCSPELAATRFVNRSRHKGHLDSLRDCDSLLAQAQALSHNFPLGIGTLITVNTEDTVDDHRLAVKVQDALDQHSPLDTVDGNERG